MPATRKPTQAELRELVSQAAALTAQECQAWHPEKGVRCQLGAGHQGSHEWRAVSGARPWLWSDTGETGRPARIWRR